jgi:peptidoglycan/xylan/chitin deacetylase (PgdA/CDA1 family)
VPGHYVSESRFKAQMALISALGMKPTSLMELYDGFQGRAELPPKPVVITFDDGYESFCSIGLSVLKERGYKATVFLVSNFVGKTNIWDQEKGDVMEPLMTRSQVLEAVANGMEFGSHTKTHLRLGEVNPKQASEEILGSKIDLEEWLPQPVRFFCYPYGSHSPEVRRLVQEAGYAGATTVMKGVNDETTDPFSWGRINVRKTTSAFVLAYKLFRTRRVL